MMSGLRRPLRALGNQPVQFGMQATGLAPGQEPVEPAFRVPAYSGCRVGFEMAMNLRVTENLAQRVESPVGATWRHPTVAVEPLNHLLSSDPVKRHVAESRQQLTLERDVDGTPGGWLEAVETLGSPDVGDKVAEMRYESRRHVVEKVHVAGLNGQTPGPRFVDGHVCHGTEGPAL